MKSQLLFLTTAGIIMTAGYFVLPDSSPTEFDSKEIVAGAEVTEETVPEELIPEDLVLHKKTPENVIGVYFTSWAAGTKSYQEKLDDIIENTSVNTVVIDIKDYTGKVGFLTENELINEVGGTEERIKNIKDYFKYLHEKDIYIIGRLSVFQDTHYVKKYPEVAVKTLSGEVWRDRKKIPWVEAGAEEYWPYIIEIAKEAYAIGYDEINFDYIRFPSDGNMKDIAYAHTDGRTRREVMKSFYEYLNKNMTELGIPHSADLFGLVTTASDDLGIGQYLEDALPYFDQIMPMVYPSHFADGWYNIPKPGKEPGKVIHLSMKRALERTVMAGYDANKLRPWIQDFDLGATYTPELVRDQIQASLSLGIQDFILWDPGIKYQTSALNIEDYDLTVTEIIKKPEEQVEQTTSPSEISETTEGSV